MKLKLIFLFTFLSSIIFAQDPIVFQLDSVQIIDMVEWLYAFSGDTSESPFVDDFEWRVANQKNFLKSQKGIHWYKADLQLKGEQNPNDFIALQIYNLPIAYEIYWDGHVIERNGIPSRDKKKEESGKVYRRLLLPPASTRAGEHQLIFKISNMHWTNPKLPFAVSIGYNTNIQSEFENILVIQIRQMSIYLLSMLICLVLYLGGIKNRSLLLWSGYSFFILIPYVISYFEYTGFVNSIQFQWMQTFKICLILLRYILLLSFLMYFFESPLKRTQALIAILFLLLSTAVVFMWNVILILHSIRTFLVLFSLIISLLFLRKKIAGSRFIVSAFILVLIQFVLQFFTDFSHVHFIFYLFFPILIIVGIIIKVSDQYRRFQIISLEAKKLEDELLEHQKKIQYIVYRKKNENHLIPINDIRFFKAERFLVEAHLLTGDMELIEKPLNKLEEILPNHFFRIHRSFIVNLQHVDSYKSVSGGMYEMHLKDGKVLPVSRSRVKKLNELLRK